MADVCVVGSFMADVVVRAARRPGPGETVRGRSATTYLGGKGFNQAIAAARSGASTSMVGALGNDQHGRLFRSALAVDGVDAAGVLEISDVGTGIAFPLVEDDGQNSIVIVPQANESISVADIEALADHITAASIVVLQLELLMPTAIAAARIAKAAGATVVLNPAPAVDSLADFAGLVDLIVPNESEAAALTGIAVDRSSAARAARSLCSSLGASSAVFTLGHDGAVVLSAESATWIPAHRVDVVDTVGAGDAFCGALAAELARGVTLESAAIYANAAGALATTKPGAEPSMPSRVDVLGLLEADAVVMERVLTPAGTEDSSVLADIDRGRTPPSSWYTDSDHFLLERDRVLRRSWHFVTDLDTIPEAGDALPVEVAGVPVVLVRAADDTVDGFVNICRHRGTVVLEAQRRRSLTCHYHGWSYDLEGALRGVPQANGDVPFDPTGVCLPRVQVAVWGPMVWVCPNLDAPSFAQWTAGLDERLLADGCDVRRHRRLTVQEWTIPCNWKVFQDNTIECYHCPTSHPEFSRAVVQDPARQVMEVGSRHWIHHTIPFRDGIPDGITHGRVEGRPFDYHYSWIFPATYLQHSGRGFDIGTVDAVAVDRIRFRHLWFGPADTSPEDVAQAQHQLDHDVTIPQDVVICTRVQQAHASGMAPVGLLVPGREALLTHLYRVIAEMVAEP